MLTKYTKEYNNVVRLQQVHSGSHHHSESNTMTNA